MAAPSFDSQDVQNNRLTGGLGYLLPFVPFLACPNSKFGKYCANQGWLLWIVMLAIRLVVWVAGLVLGWIRPIGWLLDFASFWVLLVVLLLELYYTYVAMARGEAKEVPVIGSITLIK